MKSNQESNFKNQILEDHKKNCDLIFNKEQNKYILELVQKKYSKFDNIIIDIITPQAGEQSKFINVLQNKLNNSK